MPNTGHRVGAWLLALFLAPTYADADGPTASAAVERVIDGDTADVSVRVRVACLDAPERGEPRWGEARDRLMALLEGEVTIQPVPSQDPFGRLVAHVYAADGRSVAQVMRAEGFEGWRGDANQPWCGDMQ